MGFIYGRPMLPKSDESCIACFVTCETTIYSTFVDDITIEVCFLLFQLIVHHFPIKKRKTKCGFAIIHTTNPICITINTHLCASANNIIIPNIGTLTLVNIPLEFT